jgi:hypothetical protein
LKVLSLWEPYATLFAMGAKKIETRGWPTAHRGWTAVHACKGGLGKVALQETISEPIFAEALKDVLTFHRGCIIGVVSIVACMDVDSIFARYPELDTPRERAFGDYSEGRYGFLAAPQTFMLPTPIPWRGRQGKFLELPEAITAEIRSQWKAAGGPK